MLSLGGIPATGGFLGKYLVFSVAVRAEMIAAAVIGILLSVVALGLLPARRRRDVHAARESRSTRSRADARDEPAAMALVCAAMVLVLGVLPGWFLDNLR